MNFIWKIVVYRFVVGRGVTVESGFSFVSLFWGLECQGFGVWCCAFV